MKYQIAKIEHNEAYTIPRNRKIKTVTINEEKANILDLTDLTGLW